MGARVSGAGVLAPREAVVSLAAARRAIATGWLEAAGALSGAGVARLGEVVLEAHQVAAVARVRRVIEEGGGALLADPVGTGKTYVALAVAATSGRVVVVGPAVLAEMWRAAMARCGVRARWVSFEGLSRGVAVEGGEADLVIVDEGHQARTPSTRRFAALAELCRRARVLVLSATPVHNDGVDVRALVSLWRGEAAYSSGDDELASAIVRRTDAEVRSAMSGRSSLPEVGDPVWVPVGDDGAVLEALLAVPSPLAPSDGGGAEWLVTMGLVRQWASSEGALRAAIGRRLGQCVALEAALVAGRHPGRRELRGWGYAEGVVQLAFPELVSSVEVGAEGTELLLAAVRAHGAGLRVVQRALGERPTVDGERAERLLEIVGRHAGERVVAFAGYGATVEALFRRVSGRVQAAVLTGRGGRVAGGELSRGEVLARFAPRANGGGVVGAAERVDLLLTTDLLSEGVNLQDASVVVHLDLPWTPARMAQRVGRVARMGSEARRVSVYALAPPATAERALRAEERLRAKAGAAARSVGAVGVILPGVGEVGASTSAVEAWAELGRVVRGWVVGAAEVETGPAVAVVGATGRRGFVALVRRGSRAELVASEGEGASVAAGVVLAAVRAADGGAGVGEAGVDGEEAERLVSAMRTAIARWGEGERVALDVGLRGGSMAVVRRRVLERIARAVRRAPRHARAGVGALAVAARAAAVAGYGVGAERVLVELERAEMEDGPWLRAVGAFGALHARRSNGPAGGRAAGAGVDDEATAGSGRVGRGATRLLAAVVFSA